ncbi:MAG: hypothetical protein OXE99_02815 [Cellvibrionales bacterium]|nr:hypothetical protein [Cellvibrionales bacterium]
MKKLPSKIALTIYITLLFTIQGCVDIGSSSDTPTSIIEEDEMNSSENMQESEDSGNMQEIPCEELPHVSHLPWDERPSACPTGDWCMKKDDGLIDGAVTWYGLQFVNQYATITCKIDNKCYRFVGMNNCHYDLYDPGSNSTLMPESSIPWARKDGHSYLNFRVRLPDSNTIYNFMSTTAEAQQDAKQAVYCPADVYAPDGAEPLLFDPREGYQGIGCGPDSPIIGRYGDTREAIPYDTDFRNAYDWTYKQNGEEAK